MPEVGVWYGLSCTTPVHMLRSWSLVSQNMTFGDKVFTKLKMKSLRWPLLEDDWSPCRKGIFGDRPTHRENVL